MQCVCARAHTQHTSPQLNNKTNRKKHTQKVGLPGYAHYCASKAGMMGLLKTAAIENAKHRITFNAVLPGNIRTPMIEAAPADYIDTVRKAIPAGALFCAVLFSVCFCRWCAALCCVLAYCVLACLRAHMCP